MDDGKDIDAQVLVEDDDARLRSLGITPVLDRSGLLLLLALRSKLLGFLCWC
jgi:hypothetical protein